jgi:c(7)-type cytochrome triheme protein
MRITLLICFLVILLPEGLGADNYFWEFPPAPPPEEYGNLLINRTSERNGVKAATFSHWIHRLKYTCRVCHFEFEFNMKANTTEITEEANRSGRYCGSSACHDGKTTFGHDKGNCEKCHNGDIGYGKDKFSSLAGFPTTKYGNGVNWSKALKRGLIDPVNHLMIKPSDIPYDKMLTLEAEWLNIPPAFFPHKTHITILDCNNCHPDIFNIKKKATKHFSMELNLKGEYCGVCHMTVAFPMSECNLCHPAINN